MKSQYKVEEMKFSDLQGSVALPTYQRQLVWSESKKLDFIRNISKGFPFGSILLYKYEDDKKQSLIDGLQRYSTLREYSEQPAKYFEGFDPYLNQVIKHIEEGTGIELSPDQRADIEGKLLSIFRICLENPSPSLLFIRDEVKSQISLYPSSNEYGDKLINLQGELINDAKQYLDLSEVIIPCIIFTGDEKQLPEVFANLNKGGTKLSKYQVFAAHWTRYEFKLSNSPHSSSLLAKVIERYSNLEDSRDLEILDFDKDEMETKRKINLSEFCYALGELIMEETPVFWGTGARKNEDTINVVGYLSAAIALGVDVRKIDYLPDMRGLFESEEFIESFTANILKDYKAINNVFSRWLLPPGTDRNEYENSAITDMQALSFFAALWHKRCKVDQTNKAISIIENYQTLGYDQVKSNLVAHCVSDIVSRTWQGSGDSRLANYYIKGENALNSYYTPIEKDTLRMRLLAWYEEATSKGSVNIEKISKLLLCIHAAPDRISYTADSYDIEHVIAKARLKKDNRYSTLDIPGGVLGNLMYLKEKTNRGKKQNNLYYLQTHEGIHFDEEYLKRIEYPSKTDIFGAEEELDNNIGLKSKSLIETRGKTMIEQIVEILGS